MRNGMKNYIGSLLPGAGYAKNSQGDFVVQLGSEGDTISNEQIRDLLVNLTGADPVSDLHDWLAKEYQASADDLEAQIFKYVLAKLTSESGPLPDGLSRNEQNVVFGMIDSMLVFEPPTDHILKQEVCVNIMVDTGDGNYDFVNNVVYKESAWGKWQTMLATKAAITWLAKTQGYTRRQLWQAMGNKKPIDYTSRTPVGFLKSMQKELLNLSTEFSILVFPVRMPLGQLLDLNRCIALQDRNGYHYDASENPYCGYLDLDKSVPVGLCDPFGGSGSLFEIELERDIRLPIRYIFSALPDGTHPNSCPLAKVYGVNEDFWAPAAKVVKGLRLPKKLLENEKKGGKKLHTDQDEDQQKGERYP